jgi:hypothetical protein
MFTKLSPGMALCGLKMSKARVSKTALIIPIVKIKMSGQKQNKTIKTISKLYYTTLNNEPLRASCIIRTVIHGGIRNRGIRL